jgi:protein gp37/ParB-like chromosome segregation protein Spo0J
VKIHPVAKLFPRLEPTELALLVADIKANGQHVEIVLTPDGTTIVDGINRHKACGEAGLKPKFRSLPKGTTELEIINFIISANMRRRDLDAGQKAVIWLQIAPYLEAVAKARMVEGGKTAGRGRPNKGVPQEGQAKARAPRVVDQIGKAAGVGHNTVSKAKKVMNHSLTLAADVAAGKIKLNDAHKQVRKAEAASQVAAEKEKPSRATTIVLGHDGKQVEYQLPKGRAKFNATNDQVSWAAWTWNPLTGCLHNCKYCYAREGAVMNRNLAPFYPLGFAPTFYDYRLEAPAHSKVPEGVKDDARLGRVFVSSMGDLFGKWVPDEWITKVFAAAHGNPDWEYLFLTKFPQRYVGLDLPPTAWIGTTVDEQYRVKIAEEAFRKIKGVRVKWLSLEPLLTPLKFTDLSMFDFVVIGSQSATEQPDGKVPEFAPPFDWVARLTEQAHAAGCKVYQKPNLLGVTDPQHAGMKLVQEVPDLPPLPRRQGELLLTEAAE